MKARNSLFLKSPALSLVMFTLSFNLMAQQNFGSEDTTVINNNNAVVNTTPIDVDGYLKEEAPVTDQELEEVQNELNKQKNAIEINRKKKDSYRDLQKTTKTLTTSTEKYLKERSSAKKDIDAYNKKLECLMETENPDLCKDVADQVKSQQAAVQKVETNPGWGSSTGVDRFKVIPYVGSTAYLTGNDQDQLISRFKTGAVIEADFGSRFSGGLGFSYSLLNTRDYGNNYFGLGNNLFDPGREIRYRNMTIDALGKYSFYRSDRIRTYFGVNASLNFAKINYENNNNQFVGFNPYQIGNEELFANFFSLGLNVGSEFYFTKTIGMNLDLGYTKGVGGQFNSRTNQNSLFFPDQRRLRDLGDEIAKAHALSLTAGMLIAF